MIKKGIKCLLCFLLLISNIACSKTETYDQNIEAKTIEKVDGQAYAEVRSMGSKSYYVNSEAPHYTIFKVEGEVNSIFSTKYVDEDLSFYIPKGEYTIVSQEIGTKEFEIKEEETILIVLDYSKKEIRIEMNYDFEKE